MRTMVRVAIAILVSVLMASAAHAKRVALVVGINKYDNLPSERQLTKAVNDARAMEAALKAVGFDVIKAEDVGRSAFHHSWQQLLDTVALGDEVAVFYSGHGVEIDGANYLVPRDVPAVATGQTQRLKNESLSFDSLRRDLVSKSPKLSLFILDACRDNPFTDSRGKSIGGTKGLVPVPTVAGSFIMFAADAFESALDRLSDTDRDPNSVYTRKLLPLLKQSGLRLPDMAQRVRREVRQSASAVGHQQNPAYYDQGGDEVCLAGCAPQTSEAERTWAWLKNTTDQSVLENFIKQFGDTPFGAEAKARLAELKKQQVAVAVPPKAPPLAPSPALAAPPPDADPARRLVVLITSTKTRAETIASMSALQTKYGQALAGTSLGIQEADLGSKGVWYRGLIGPPMSSDAANRVCTNLKVVGGQCSVMAVTAAPFIPLGASELQAACDGVEALVGNERRCLKPKDSFKDCPECPEMVVVPAGEFMMGSPASEAARSRDEGPQRKVTIAKPFAIGQLEVTFAEWDACVAAGGCKHKSDDQGLGRGKRPVVDVSWDHITKEFLPWLSRKAEKEYRLLTEAEWEYAARAGTTTPFSTGRMITTDQANFNGNDTYGGSAKGQYRQRTVEVGSFPPNAFGLHDMHGNVWEWVQDCHKDGYAPAPPDGRAVTDTSDCYRVMRGGSWNNGPAGLRSARRERYAPIDRFSVLGFRLARTFD
jgi:formylglycine-generating enzyme required for sulfatase activity